MLLYTLSFVLNIAMPAVIVRWDLAQLTGERLARSWPDASLWSAVVLFGPFCVPIHFLRTRRSWWGVGLAAFWLLCALLLVTLPVYALGRIFEIDA